MLTGYINVLSQVVCGKMVFTTVIHIDDGVFVWPVFSIEAAT